MAKSVGEETLRTIARYLFRLKRLAQYANLMNSVILVALSIKEFGLTVIGIGVMGAAGEVAGAAVGQRHPRGLPPDLRVRLVFEPAEFMNSHTYDRYLFHACLVMGPVIERMFRDCRSFHFEEGTAEIQKLVISRELLKG